jgi:hypothetical protein
MIRLPFTTRLRFLWFLFRPEPVEFFTGFSLIGWGLGMFFTNDVRLDVSGTVMAGFAIGLGVAQEVALFQNPPRHHPCAQHH